MSSTNSLTTNPVHMPCNAGEPATEKEASQPRLDSLPIWNIATFTGGTLSSYMGLGPKPATLQFFTPCVSQSCPLVMETCPHPLPCARKTGKGAERGLGHSAPSPGQPGRWFDLPGPLPNPAPLAAFLSSPFNLQVSQVLIYPDFWGEEPPFILLRLEKKKCAL